MLKTLGLSSYDKFDIKFPFSTNHMKTQIIETLLQILNNLAHALNKFRVIKD